MKNNLLIMLLQLFHQSPEAETLLGKRQQGILRITRHGETPLYFIIPFNYTGLWNIYGDNDNSIYYGRKVPAQPWPQSCSGGEDVQEDYMYKDQNAYLTNSFFGNTNTDVLATTDYNTINSFWNSSSPQIVVAFGKAGLSTFSTIKTFIAPDLSGSLTYTTKVCELDLNSLGEYMIRRNFDNTIVLNGIITSGTSLQVRVQTKFKNTSNEINAVQNFTATDNLDRVAIDIRGLIKDFDQLNPNVVQYKITVYKQ